MNLEHIKQQIQGSAILGALLSEGAIQIVYKQPRTDDGLLFRTWTIEVLIVDEDYTDQVRSALDGLGYELVQRGSRIVCTKDTPITDRERADKQAADVAEQARQDAAAADRREALLLQTLEAMQKQIDDLKDEVEMLRLVRAKGGPAGPMGPAGRDGRDGMDLQATETSLSDLADVAASDPAKGLVLTWTGIAWEPKPTQMIASISGGGGSGGGGGSIDVGRIDAAETRLDELEDQVAQLLSVNTLELE